MNITFASDLHLSKEKTWTLEVLNELVEKASQISNFLILGGDVFDSFKDLKNLKDFFVSTIENSSLEKVFFVPGNHDIMGSSLEELAKFNFGNKISFFTEVPFSKTTESEIDFLIIPFQRDLSALYKQNIDFSNKNRIVVGHGSIINFNYSDEEENSFFDKEFFNILNANFVLLGHIHKYISIDRKIIYPGSARIWRKGEYGKHGFIVVDTMNNEITFQELQKGGTYLKIDVEIDGENYQIKRDIEDLPANCFLEFFFKGIVYNSNTIEMIKDVIKNLLKNKQILNPENDSLFNTDNVINATDYYNLEIFKTFMEKWKYFYENETKEEEKENYLLARKLFIEELKEFSIGGKN